MSSETVSKLSEAELARIKRNREKALSLRANRLVNRPYEERKPDSTSANGETRKAQRYDYNISCNNNHLKRLFLPPFSIIAQFCNNNKAGR